MAEVNLRDVRKAYGTVQVLRGIDVDVADGEFVALVGPSGCGKSTLLRMIAGLEDIAQGEIRIDDRLVNNVPPKQRDVAMVFQNYALYPHMTVARNMGFSLKLAGRPQTEIDERVAAAAAILDLSALLDRYPRQLSGGQRQRVAMGRAIVRDPQVFLFDEPLSNLDAKLRGQMRVEIKNLQRNLGVTSVYVTHDQLEAMTLADMLVVMNGGLIEQVGAPMDIYEKPASTFVAAFIGAPPMNLLALTRDAQGRAPVAGGAVLHGGVPDAAAIVGLRPEDALIVTTAGQAPAFTLPVTVEAVEPVGMESFLHCATGGVRIVVRVPGRSLASPGDRLDVTAGRDRLHFFDKDGKRV